MNEDWTLAEAKNLSKFLRDNGIKAKAIKCKHINSYCLVYLTNEDKLFKELIKRIKQEGWDGFYIISREVS